MVEDYAVIYCGSAIFKIARLLFVAMLCVHMFACAFYKVKQESAENFDDVQEFYSSRKIDPNVTLFPYLGKISACN